MLRPEKFPGKRMIEPPLGQRLKAETMSGHGQSREQPEQLDVALIERSLDAKESPELGETNA